MCDATPLSWTTVKWCFHVTLDCVGFTYCLARLPALSLSLYCCRYFISCPYLKGGGGRACRAIRGETARRLPSSQDVSWGFFIPSTGLSSVYVLCKCFPGRLPSSQDVSRGFFIPLTGLPSGLSAVYVFWVCLSVEAPFVVECLAGFLYFDDRFVYSKCLLCFRNEAPFVVECLAGFLYSVDRFVYSKYLPGFQNEAPLVVECLVGFPPSVNRFVFWICLPVMSSGSVFPWRLPSL